MGLFSSHRLDRRSCFLFWFSIFLQEEATLLYFGSYGFLRLRSIPAVRRGEL